MRVLENWMPAGMTLSPCDSNSGTARRRCQAWVTSTMRWMLCSFQERGGETGVVPGGERGVFDPAGRNAVFALQDVLHDAALGEGAAVGFAAGDQNRQAAGAVQMGGVAQAFQADAVEGVAAVFSGGYASSAAEDDDGVRRLQLWPG